MDWSKAKNIIIMALLVTNLAIGGFYLSQLRHDAEVRKAAMDASVNYLQSVGVEVEAELSDKAKALPVVFVNVTKELAEEAQSDGVPVEVTGAKVGVKVAAKGDTAGEIISADKALLKLFSRLGGKQSCKGLKITEVKLVYLLDVRNAVIASQDTAVPSWKIQTSRGTYYIDAYSE